MGPGWRVARFLLLALPSFALLMALALTGFYPPLFCRGANLLFGRLGADRVARFEPLEDRGGVADTTVSVGLILQGAPRFPSSIAINSVREGFTPVALLTSLVLTTPLAWRKRLRALGLGLLLVHAFVGARILVALLYGFSRVGVGDRRLLDVGSLGSAILHRADQILTGDLHLTFVVPLVIWALITSVGGFLRSPGDAPSRDAALGVPVSAAGSGRRQA